MFYKTVKIFSERISHILAPGSFSSVISNLFIRFLFCAPFVVTAIYIQSYHGELINNAEVEWQYVKNDEGRVYLALDVYSPSGIEIAGIFSDRKDVTDSWSLTNYPDWYKGRENFKDLPEFQDVLHPYLPYNNDFNILYTSGWYTFLYEWRSEQNVPIPPETSIKIKYRNVSTQNYYKAEWEPGVRIISKIIESTANGPVVDVQILYPHQNNNKNRQRIYFDNLVPDPVSQNLIFEDLDRNDYQIAILDLDRGIAVDSLKGFVRWENGGKHQVFAKRESKKDFPVSLQPGRFVRLVRHFAAMTLMVYFALAFKYAGKLFIRRSGIALDNYADNLILPFFLGIILLTYLFFIIGLLKLLYFPILFAILLVILFCGFVPGASFTGPKNALSNQFKKIKKSPWRIISLTLLTALLYYNLSYCFIPATFLDGSGDIVNSNLPILNSYIISHSFETAVYNVTYGMNPQTLDVLRTVAKIFMGEPGIYLLSFVYLLLFLGGVYLIGKKIFNINNMLAYITIMLLLSVDIFTESIHLGKLHIAAVSFLIMSLYSLRYFEHDKNFILPALFLAFLISQYPIFIVAALAYYFFIFTHSYYHQKRIKASGFKLHKKLHTISLIIFCLLASVFSLKQMLEVGVSLPTGLIPPFLSDMFLWINQNNDFYKYIDNNYIRNFYRHHELDMNSQPDVNFHAAAKSVHETLNYYYLLLLLPFLVWNRYRAVYFVVVFAVFLMLFFGFQSNTRLKIYYFYPILILQFFIIDSLILKLKKITVIKNAVLKKIITSSAILLMIFVVVLDIDADSHIRIHKFKIVELIKALNSGTDSEEFFIKTVLPVFHGEKSEYEYLHVIRPEVIKGTEAKLSPHGNFDHAMLIRQYSDIKDTILTVPVRFHSHTMRNITPRHALGSVIYQKDMNKIMEDLERLNIKYLSTVPIHYDDYNPYYTPVFEDNTFYKYFKLLFSYSGRRFYKIIFDGSNEEYSPTPYNVNGLPFVPMIKET